MTRRRIRGREGWPEGLIQRKCRGKDRLIFRDEENNETWFPVGTTLENALSVARAYNEQHRNPVHQLIKKMDKYNKPLSEWLPKVAERVKEENLGESAQSNFDNDYKRLMESHGHVRTKTITLETVNEFLQTHYDGKSNNVLNRKISFLKKVFSYLCDMSAMESNPAELKKFRKAEDKQRQRLGLEQFKEMLRHAEPWLNTAMQLAFQTTHAVNEIQKVKYSDCEWFKKPEFENGLTVYGVLRIHRQKVKKKEASRVAIPITPELKSIIKGSYDKVASPYIVHKKKLATNELSRECDHWTQMTNRNISSGFSGLRDKLGLYDHLDKKERPTFHEIRALAIHLFDKAGVDPQSRAAHTDAKSTKIYKQGHIDWVEVPPAELKL